MGVEIIKPVQHILYVVKKKSVKLVLRDLYAAAAAAAAVSKYY